MPDYIVLSCPNCGAKTSVQAGTGLITCDYCGSQMLLKPDGGAVKAPAQPEPVFVVAGEPAARPRGQAPRPRNITVEQGEGVISLTRRWFNASYLGMAFFCVFWDGFLCFWYSMAFGSRAPLVFILFPLIHLSVGVVMTYTTLAGFLNSTRVTIDREGVAVQHYPLPWPGSRTLPPGQISQLYTQEVYQRSKNGSSTTYTLSAILRTGEKIDLLKGLDSAASGLFMEQQMETVLGIQDRPVAGEVGR